MAWLEALVSEVVKTSSPYKLSTSTTPGASGAQEAGTRATASSTSIDRPGSPALSTASTADGDESDEAGLDSSPGLPSLPAPRLPGRAQALLETSSPGLSDNGQFGTASWGSPYPQSDHNLRRESFSSEESDESPIHTLAIDTPFLRPPPELSEAQPDEPESSVSAAAAVLANRVRRQTRGLTEDWIRTHTAGDSSVEPRNWFSDGTGSEHSSLSGSEIGWLDDHDLSTPKGPTQKVQSEQPQLRRPSRRHPRARSSLETLKPENVAGLGANQSAEMASDQADTMHVNGAGDPPQQQSQRVALQEVPANAESMVPQSPKTVKQNTEPRMPVTPTRKEKPLPKEPATTPRLKKKVPWKGKNIMVLLPRDEERGRPNHPPKPLRQDEIERMFSAWDELGYDVHGFDLLVEGYQPPGTDDSQSRVDWPAAEDLLQERTDKKYNVALPDLNAWKNYVNELQEAKLRALGVSLAPEEPEEPAEVSPPTRQASGQFSGMPFSPPGAISSASSNQNMGYPFPPQFVPGRGSSNQSPGVPNGASPVPFATFNPRQSISIPAGQSPFQFPAGSLQGWQGVDRVDSPLQNLNGILSPQSPFGIPSFLPGSPALNAHQRGQSLQYPVLPHQQLQQQQARASPRLQEVREDEEEDVGDSTQDGPFRHVANGLQTEIEDAQYHLEQQFRNLLEHEDYNPQVDASQAFSHARDASGPEHHFVNEPGKPLTLQHPTPHSRGHSLTQNNYYNDADGPQDGAEQNGFNNYAGLKRISENQDGDDQEEIETNPSNLGSPNQNYFPGFGQHQKTMSTASNPWNEGVSAHSRKPSSSKFNVKAPEFHYNPASNFTPGLLDLSAVKTQPVVFNAATNVQPPEETQPKVEAKTDNSIPQFGTDHFKTDGPSFAPSKSKFSFSASGPKFRPDAPSFTPSHGVGATVPFKSRRTDSIFGNIQLPAEDIIKPAKINKAIPIIKPSSRGSATDPQPADDKDLLGADLDAEARVKRARSSDRDDETVAEFAERPEEVEQAKEPEVLVRPEISEEPEQVEKNDQVEKLVEIDEPVVVEEPARPEESELEEGEVVEDEAETELAPVKEEVAEPVTVEEPIPEVSEELTEPIAEDPASSNAKEASEPAEVKVIEPSQDEHVVEATKEEESAAEVATHVDQNNPADTSMSSALDSEHVDTKATTAAPSQTSPIETSVKSLTPFEFDPKFDSSNFNTTQPFGDDNSKSREEHSKNLSATAPAFTPGAHTFASSVTSNAGSTKDELTPELDRSFRAPSPIPQSKGLGASRFAPKPKGLAASRFASSGPTSPVEQSEAVSTTQDTLIESIERDEPEAERVDDREPTFEEIDAVMQDMKNDPSQGVKKSIETAHHEESLLDLQPPVDHVLQKAYSPTPRAQQIPPPDLEDPFVDPPAGVDSQEHVNQYDEAEPRSAVASDWENTFTEDEHEKLENRAQFFDGRVNEVVGNLLASRLEPMEKTLLMIQDVLAAQRRRPASSRRRDVRDLSTELQESDADDEDEEPAPRRSLSPRKDRKLEQIRTVIVEALAAQAREQPAPAAIPEPTSLAAPEEPTENPVLKALDEMREQFTSHADSTPRGDHLKELIENAVQSRMAPPAGAENQTPAIVSALDAKVAELEEKLAATQKTIEEEVSSRRAAQDESAELNRKLQAAETRVEVEIINRSVFDQRVADLEERLRNQEGHTEEEINMRRNAEDKLSENQRLLRISSEEEDRLRELVEEREGKIKTLEQTNGKTAMRMVLLEAAQNNATQSQSESTNRINVLEADLKTVRQDNNHWRMEAERADEDARRKGGELAHVTEENKTMQKSLDTLTSQLEENERLRETWRAKFMSLQEDMSQAAREVSEENAKRIKKDQSMIARQEVLDARLQAEAKTRERLEIELDRLQMNERTGMRAANECKRLEGILGDLKTENHNIGMEASRYKRDFEEAKETGANELKRMRMSLQTEIDSANHQVNVIREELEEQNTKLRTELDNVKMEFDTAKAQNEMLLEEAHATKATEVEAAKSKHLGEVEDLQHRWERQLSNAVEDGQKTEQHLLERLSLSSSKIEHLQDKIVHLEDKLEISKQAAAAAVAAAKQAGIDAGAATAAVARSQPAPTARKDSLPEKISPQALRESIMVLQEQLQAREQRIEELEQTVAKLDPDAASKISKRDDEISWLRELLAVRHGDMQDIINALSSERYDREVVKDAVIRLKANMAMEEQERERALNGGSAITLPNIAQTISQASPRVAQAGGAIAAAWGNWRKNNQSLRSISGVLNSPNATPSKSSPRPGSSRLGGLMTPPTSSMRSPPADDKPQPTAFGSTGRRFPSHSSQAPAPRPRLGSNSSRRLSNASHQSHNSRRPSNTVPVRHQEPEPVREEDPSPVHLEEDVLVEEDDEGQAEEDEPLTPLMNAANVYDSDAQPGDFDDGDFFEDE